MPTKTVNNVTFHHLESGRGPNLVFVHGFPLDSRMWENQIAHFSSRFRCIAPDLRGFGQSISREPFSIESLADDVRALLLQLEALPCVLCGLSMGGYVALAYVKKCPSELRALALIDTRAEADTAEGKANRNKMIELVRASGANAISDQMMPKLLSQQTMQSKPAVVQKLRQITQGCPVLTIEHALAAMRDREDYTNELASIAVPTFIAVGEHDTLTPPPMSRAMHERISRSQLAIIPGAGHMTPMEQPGAFNEQLARFLTDLAG